MKDGILKESDGWDIVVNGVNRTFSDVEAQAIEAVTRGKQRQPGTRYHIRCRADGSLREVLPDGRLRPVSNLD